MIEVNQDVRASFLNAVLCNSKHLERTMKFEDTQPYKLGVIYRQLADLLMNPKTDMSDLTEFGSKMGFRVCIEIVPDEDSPLNGA